MKWRKISDKETKRMFLEMQQAEQNGFFDQMFQNIELKEKPPSPTKEDLLARIRSDMRLNKAFFLTIYSYSIIDETFKEIALKRLVEVGCSKAYQYYDFIINDYLKIEEEQEKEVAAWFLEENERRYQTLLKEGDKQRKQQEKRSKHWTQLENLLNYH